MTLFQLLLLVILGTFANGLKRSAKYLKTKIAPYAFPIDVCYPKRMGASKTSIRLVCEEDCDVGGGCERRVVSYHYGPDNVKCEGDPLYTDVFSEVDRERYPFNCYEDEEFDEDGALTDVTIDPNDYAQSYMVIRISKGQWIENDDEGECVKDESSAFYKTFPAITNRCVMGWSGSGRNAKPYWYYTMCNENATYVERYEGYNCTGNQTDAYPIYKPNGCDQRKWNNQYWYSEVLQCSHPDYSIGIGFRNRDNIMASIVFILTIACWYMI
eukprot:104683_1